MWEVPKDFGRCSGFPAKDNTLILARTTHAKKFASVLLQIFIPALNFPEVLCRKKLARSTMTCQCLKVLMHGGTPQVICLISNTLVQGMVGTAHVDMRLQCS